MKNLKKLSEKALVKATILTTEQMQAVTGGARYICYVFDADVHAVIVEAFTKEEAFFIAQTLGFNALYCEGYIG